MCLFLLCRDGDVIESVLASQETQQDSDDSGFGTVQRGSTLSTVGISISVPGEAAGLGRLGFGTVHRGSTLSTVSISISVPGEAAGLGGLGVQYGAEGIHTVHGKYQY